MENFSCRLKKLSDVGSKEVIKNRKFNKLNRKKSNLRDKFPEASTLIHTNQYNTDKQNLEKKFVDSVKKIPNVSGFVIATVIITKLVEVDNKITNVSDLVIKAGYNA